MLYWIQVGVAISIGIPFAAVGLLLCATIVLIPFGMVALTISGMPLAYVVRRHNLKTAEKPLDQGPKPWMM